MIRSRTILAIPPGETIQELLEDRNMSQKEFAKRMDMSEKHISKLINGEVILTQEMAMRLEMVFGISATFFNNLEALYREDIIRVNEENAMDDDIAQMKKFPFKDMVKQTWIKDAKRKEDKVINLRQFFEVVRLVNLKKDLLPRIIANSRSGNEKNDYCLMAYAQKAKLEARNIKTSPINIRKLVNSIPEIKALINKTPKTFTPKLKELLSNSGIALVLLPQIGSKTIKGITFKDKNKAVIALPPIYEQDNTKFWHNLFHELGHIVLGHLNHEDGTTIEEENATKKWVKETLSPINVVNS